MDFVRFSGELFIYYVLIALGGGVLIGPGLDLPGHRDRRGALLQVWLAALRQRCAIVIATWLVEAKQSVIENMAPVLARLFAPLFALVLLIFLVTIVWTGRGSTWSGRC